MALENGTYVNSLVPANPVSTDGIAQADDHIRLIKSVIKNTFPNITGAVTVTQANLNNTTSIPSSLTDLSISDGSANQVLQTDGSGNFSFVSLPAGSTDTNYYVTGGSVSGTVLTLNRQGLGNINIGGLPAAITNNNQLTNGAGYITSAQATSPTSFGAVGTYAFLVRNGVSISSGSSVAGSTLQSGGVNAVHSVTTNNWVYSANLTQLARGDTTMSGTWRAMGSVTYNGSSTYGRGTVFLRIS
jgi:hypothetical protein